MRVGDKVVLTDNFIAQNRYLGFEFGKTVAVVMEVLTEWDKDDVIRWDMHISFNGEIAGVYREDVEKV
jgi:hypothetical protein